MTDDWTPGAASTRIVLLGADTFRSGALSDLPAVRNNLTDLSHALTGKPHGLLAGHPANCTVLGLDGRADQDAVGEKLSAASGEAEELLLVYYSGHGVLDVDGKLHLALRDTDPRRPGYTALSLDLIKRDLAGARARARVLILDCCFSGRAINTMAETEQLVAEQLTLTGTYILASTSANKPSLVLPGQRNTAFTAALLRSLSEPEPLTLDEIYARTDTELGGLGLPRPRCASTDAGRRLALARGPVPEHADNVVPRRRRKRWVPAAAAVVLAGAIWAGTALLPPEDEASPPAPTTPTSPQPQANAAPPAPPPPQVRQVEDLTVDVSGTGKTPDGAIALGVTTALASANANGSKTVAGGGGEGEGGAALTAEKPTPGSFTRGFADFYVDTAMENCTARNVGVGEAVVTGTADSWVKVVVTEFNLPKGPDEKLSVTFRVEQGTGELPASDQLCL